MKRIAIISLLSLFAFNAMAEQLPTDLNWISNQNEPLFASEQAKQGGTCCVHAKLLLKHCAP